MPRIPPSPTVSALPPSIRSSTASCSSAFSPRRASTARPKRPTSTSTSSTIAARKCSTTCTRKYARTGAGDHGGDPDLQRPHVAAGRHAGAGVSGGTRLPAVQAAALSQQPPRRGIARPARWGRRRDSTSPRRAHARCSRSCARARTCRGCARRTRAALCSPPPRSAITRRSSGPPWGARSSSSTRTTSTSSAFPSSTSWDWAGWRRCAARSMRSKRAPVTRPKMYELPIDDRATYEMISRGDTIGTFQIESRAQIASIVHTRPERLYDITVQVALIRPGPIVAKFVQPYTDRRRGREQVTYADPRLEPILARTQGIPDLPGTGDGDRHRARRLHAGGSRHAAPDDGQPAQGGAADRGTGGIARAPDRESGRQGRGRADRVGPARLRQLRLSRIARLEFRADRLRHGVAQDQLSHRVLPRPAQFAADGVLLGEHAAARRATTRRTVAPALPARWLS